VSDGETVVNHTKHWRWIFCAAIVVIGVAAATCAGVVLLISSTQYIDQDSGKLRYTTELCNIILTERVEQTPFSRLALGAGQCSPTWQKSSRLSMISRISPHYTFHGVPEELEGIVLACEMVGMKPDEKREVCGRVLLLLKQGHLDEIRKIEDTLENRGATDLSTSTEEEKRG
jgi:hypothetical protein